MSNITYASMLVCWKEQRRLINVKIDDDLNMIERSIIESYQLQQFNHFQEYQIQYYDEIYKTFIDLSSQTIEYFQKLIQKLLLPNPPTKDNQIWRLIIIPKAVEAIRISNNKYDDQESINTQIDTNTVSSHSVTNTEETVNQHSDNPLNFHFADDIADRQRKQYESDIGRKRNSNNSLVGGVFLQTSKLNSTNPYPTVEFQIPKDKLDLPCCLYLYILTECDSKGNYYLHASKGIHDGLIMEIDKFGPIPNSNLVNPHKIELSKTDVKQGKFEIRLRVCNIRNLPQNKHEKLRKFPELNRFMIYKDEKLISECTTAGLQLNSEKYHLGCILVYNNLVQDRCISHLAIDDHKRKRKS